ncbi:MAG TPA: hypothetical protein VN083_08625, partial [Vicinamibacteria bacterium]|nr:hypothetical protein [Vicinamibacteria bacterium]
GFGLRWNVSERVQVFTHPLWMLLVSAAYALTRDVYYTSLALSIALSFATAVLLARGIAVSEALQLFGVGLLALSKAFVDYSTSGLENPLTHFLLALFAWALFRGKSFRMLASIAGLLALNRMDSLLLVLPALLVCGLRQPLGRAVKDVLAGFLPFLLWIVFSVVYYGFPFPNTAYAKLSTGIPASDLVAQGLLYLLNSLAMDPVTLFVILLGLVVPVALRVPWARSFGVGILLFLVYTVRIGGDFMSGRFLTGAFLLSVVLLTRLPLEIPGEGLTLAFAPLLLMGLPGLMAGLTGPAPAASSSLVDPNGIADERLFYAPKAGLLTIRRGERVPPSDSAAEGVEARMKGPSVVVGGNGMFGFFAGPDVHVIDVNALGEPLLARLPAKRGWRIGHFVRAVPAGYVRDLRGKEGRIDDPKLTAYDDELRLVTSGDLLSAARWGAIFDLNLGSAGHLLDDYFRIHSRLQRVALHDVSDPRPEGSDSAVGCIPFSDHGISVSLGGVSHASILETSLENNEPYVVIALNHGELVFRQKVPVAKPPSESLALHRLSVDPRAARMGYDEIRIFPETGEDEYALGHLRVVEEPLEGRP